LGFFKEFQKFQIFEIFQVFTYIFQKQQMLKTLKMFCELHKKASKKFGTLMLGGSIS
jgi:hypothetical protein